MYIYKYGVKMIKKFRWESGFLRGVPWNSPLCTNGSAGYLMQLSVHIVWEHTKVRDKLLSSVSAKDNKFSAHQDRPSFQLV